MDVKTPFFDVMSEVQKDSEGISAGIDFLKIQYIRIFSGI
jgi:hypothetical protein